MTLAQPFDDSPRVGQLQLDPVITLPHNATLADAAAVLAEAAVPIVLIAGSPVAAVDRDDVVRALQAGADRHSLALDHASAPVIVPYDDTLLDAVAAMVTFCRDEVLVVDNASHVVGALSYGIATRALAGAPRWLGALRVALRLEQH